MKKIVLVLVVMCMVYGVSASNNSVIITKQNTGVYLLKEKPDYIPIIPPIIKRP